MIDGDALAISVAGIGCARPAHDHNKQHQRNRRPPAMSIDKSRMIADIICRLHYLNPPGG
jgi:hypothetical protein